MGAVTLPNSCLSRREKTYARLLLRVYAQRTVNAFEGVVLRPGARIEEEELRPTDEYPPVPLLLEYAGSDKSGRGHRRSNDIYILWQWNADRRRWIELIRATSPDAGWIEHLRPIALAELRRTAIRDPRVADYASLRIVALLDAELEKLETDDRTLCLSFVFEAFTARALEEGTGTGH